MNGASTSPAPSATNSTATLRWAVRVLLGEAIAVGLLAILVTWEAFTASNLSAQSAAATPVITTLLDGILAGLGVSLHRAKAWARGPAIVLEMLMIPIGYYMIVGGVAWLGVPLGLIGLIGAALLLAPTTRIALGLR